MVAKGTAEEYLAATPVIDWDHPEVFAQAKSLSDGPAGIVEVVRRCFEWVRDEIRHSWDYRLNPVTCAASEAQAARTGFCFAKSHLLAALLRANGIPAGLCYQRLSRDDNGEPFSLHGLNAVYLPEYGWHRLDARGNKPGVDAGYTPPVEKLAFTPRLDGEADFPEIWPGPLPSVVVALRRHRTWDSLWENLPDVTVAVVNRA
jgi:transglutaminase-like putative cysteine protease